MDNFVVKFTANDINNKRKKSLLDTEEVKRNFKKFNSSNSKSTQMFIDYGQKSFGKSINCPVCGMLFVLNDDLDIKSHGKFCKSTQEGNILNSTKGFQIINIPCSVTGSIKSDDSVLLGQTQSVQYIFVMKDVLILLEKELGLSSDFITIDDLIQPIVNVFLYMRGTKLIGCIIVEDVLCDRLYLLKISTKEHCVSDENESPDSLSHGKEADLNSKYVKELFKMCEKDKLLQSDDNVALGIRALWVSKQHRRQGIAQCLVDVARKHVRFGQVVARDTVAISDPTEDGLSFLMNYCGSNSVLSYIPKTSKSVT